MEATWTSDCGTCRLWLADCLDVLPTLTGVDAVVTDPPYGILNLEGDVAGGVVRKSPRQQGSGTLKNRLLNQSNVEWDSAPTADTLDRLRAMSKWQIIWGGNYFPLPPTRAVLVWDKMQPWENFSQVELAWTNLNRPAAKFTHDKSAIEDKVHPTQKPLPLMLWCLKFIPEAQAVFDPYTGSGTTGVACVRTGRKFLGIEKEPKYFEIAKARISDELIKKTGNYKANPAKYPLLAMEGDA